MFHEWRSDDGRGGKSECGRKIDRSTGTCGRRRAAKSATETKTRKANAAMSEMRMNRMPQLFVLVRPNDGMFSSLGFTSFSLVYKQFNRPNCRLTHSTSRFHCTTSFALTRVRSLQSPRMNEGKIEARNRTLSCSARPTVHSFSPFALSDCEYSLRCACVRLRRYFDYCSVACAEPRLSLCRGVRGDVSNFEAIA